MLAERAPRCALTRGSPRLGTKRRVGRESLRRSQRQLRSAAQEVQRVLEPPSAPVRAPTAAGEGEISKGEPFTVSSLTRLLRNGGGSLSTTSENALKALEQAELREEARLHQWVDRLVDFLTREEKFDLAAAVLERCAAAEVTYDASLGLFFEHCSTHQRFDIIFSTAEKWLKSENVRFRGYAANLAAYFGWLSGDVDACVRLTHMMHRYKVPFESDYPFSVTIHACNAAGRWADALEIYQLFRKTNLPYGPCIIRNILFTMREGQFHVTFKSILRELLQAEVHFNFEEFKALMETCKFFNDLPSAKRIFNDAYQQHVRLDIRSVNTLLSIYKDVRTFPPLQDIFYLWESDGIRPDCFTFALLFACGYITEQPTEVIDRIVQEAQSWDVRFNSVAISSACLAYHRAKADSVSDRISKATTLLLSCGDADRQSFHIVMRMCVDLGCPDKAMHIQEHMEAAGFPSSGETFQILRGGSLESGQRDQAAALEEYVEKL